MRRISVVGNSGSGKTTLARKLAAGLDVPHLELDSIFHQPDWQPLDRAVFVQRVDEFTRAPGWVVDGNYSAVRDLVWSRADTVIWLDLSKGRVMRQLVWRTLRRMATGASCGTAIASSGATCSGRRKSRSSPGPGRNTAPTGTGT